MVTCRKCYVVLADVEAIQYRATSDILTCKKTLSSILPVSLNTSNLDKVA